MQNYKVLSSLHFQIFTTVLTGVALALIVKMSVDGADGHLIYTLDDPYIHLAVAESILEGGYGINTGEYASPSSSILWPLLLTVPVALGVGSHGPLIYAIPSTLASIWIISGIFWQGLADSFGRAGSLAVVVLAPALILAVNAVALPMTGMEHSLHVLGCALVIRGLMDLSSPERTTGAAMTVIGILLCATIRFEGLALALAAIGGLLVLGRYRLALGTLAAVLFCLGGYVTFMTLQGLPVLPSSVLVKSSVANSVTDDGLLSSLKNALRTLFESLYNRVGVLLTLGAIWIFLDLFRPGPEARRYRVAQAVALLAILAHLAAGEYGWFSRYEIYAVSLMIVALAMRSGNFFLGRSGPVTIFGVMLMLLLVAEPYRGTTFQTPAASTNIYEQQFQMGRFAKEFWPEPVAVNDLGWVAFENDGYVLDLWGLGSELARKTRIDGGWTPEKLDHLTARKGISYAMIYDEWIVHKPSDWCRIAELKTSQVTAGNDTVAFYLVKPSLEQQMRTALESFSKTLPAGATLEIAKCNQ